MVQSSFLIHPVEAAGSQMLPCAIIGPAYLFLCPHVSSYQDFITTILAHVPLHHLW